MKQSQSRRRRKIAAVAAGALVVGLGATYTLATWNDSEWVWGGADGDPGIGTSTFDVQQNTTLPFDAADANWVDRETNPGDELEFSAGALSLAPGDTVYAPVSLRSVAKSVAGTLDLQAAVQATGASSDADLWDAIEVGVWTNSGAAPPTCDATVAADAAWTGIVPAGTALGAEAPAAQTLAAAGETTPGVPQHYCFALTLPSGSSSDLQGLVVSPAWQFLATSN